MLGALKVCHFPLPLGVHRVALKASEALAFISSGGGRECLTELCLPGGGGRGGPRDWPDFQRVLTLNPRALPPPRCPELRG